MKKRPKENRQLKTRPAGREEGVAAQVLLLKDPDPNVRLAAIGMLERFGVSAKESIPQLREMLFHEEDAAILEAVCTALINIGADPNPIISRMLEDLRSLDPRFRVKAAELLARFGGYAPRSMDRASRGRLLPDLLEFVRDNTQDARARCAIIQLLGEWDLKPKEVAPALANLLEDDDEGVRKRAMQTLEHYRPASVACTPKIIQCLRSRPGDISWYYAEGFFRFVAPVEKHADLVASALTEGLRAKAATIREMSASILGDLGAHAIPAIPALCDALKDKAPEVRREAAGALGKLGQYALRAVPALIEARHQSDVTLRGEVEVALRKIAPGEYGAVLLSESFAGQTNRRLPIEASARYLGEGRCQVGDDPPFKLGNKEAKVLNALVRLGAAHEPELIEESGVSDAARVLAGIRRKYPQLAAHIVLPGKKGHGGYSTTVKRA